MRRKPSPILGIVVGLAGAIMLSLLVLIIYAVRGPGAFERLGVSLMSTIGLYFVAGVIGGAILGLLLPLTVWRIGAVFVGMLAATPLYLGAAILLNEPDLYSGIIAAVVVGGIVGYGLWLPPPEESKARGDGSSGTGSIGENHVV